MSRAVPALSLTDNLLYNLLQVLPYYVQGIFTRNRLGVWLVARLHPDPLAAGLLRRLIRKYRSRYLYVSMLGTRSLLVLSPEGVVEVLDRSPAVFADAKTKRQGMAHFQPNAVTISRGEEWRDRRRFNEAVLGGDHDPHREAGRYLAVVAGEVAAALDEAGDDLGWRDFERLFERITLQVIFGQRARDDRPLIEGLKSMLRESNRLFGLRKSKHFDPFYDRVRAYLRDPEAGSLADGCRRAPSTEVTRVENQLPHWMFAMSETLATNSLRALALIAAHPAAAQRVRSELGGADLSSPAGVHGLVYLEGCLQEAMRLWPTTPLLVRETLAADALEGRPVPVGTQVLIMSGFNHRDRATFDGADGFHPELWLAGRVDRRFNHLSNGPQVCAGRALTLFLGKAVLALLLREGDYALRRPSLDPGRPLPHAFDHFGTRLRRRGGGRAASREGVARRAPE
jgi:cytochrome P450